MIDIKLDHSFYSDPNFDNWQILKDCLPEEFFPHQEVKHPDSICRFIALENFVIEFSHVTNGKSFQQGLCFRNENSIFDIEEEIPLTIREKYKIEASHKNRDWEKDIDEDGNLPILKQGDPRIKEGWESLYPEMGSVHPDLSLWIGRSIRTEEENSQLQKQWNCGTFRLKEINLSSAVISDPFFELLAKNTTDVKFIKVPDIKKPIKSLTIETCEEYFKKLALPQEEGMKKLRARNTHQYDLVFVNLSL